MPESISSLYVGIDSGFLYQCYNNKGVRPIVKADSTYEDLLGMFGSEYEMPPQAVFEKGDEIEYRCPYIPRCPARANCFAVGTLQIVTKV